MPPKTKKPKKRGISKRIKGIKKLIKSKVPKTADTLAALTAVLAKLTGKTKDTKKKVRPPRIPAGRRRGDKTMPVKISYNDELLRKKMMEDFQRVSLAKDKAEAELSRLKAEEAKRNAPAAPAAASGELARAPLIDPLLVPMMSLMPAPEIKTIEDVKHMEQVINDANEAIKQIPKNKKNQKQIDQATRLIGNLQDQVDVSKDRLKAVEKEAAEARMEARESKAEARRAAVDKLHAEEEAKKHIEEEKKKTERAQETAREAARREEVATESVKREAKRAARRAEARRQDAKNREIDERNLADYNKKMDEIKEKRDRDKERDKLRRDRLTADEYRKVLKESFMDLSEERKEELLASIGMKLPATTTRTARFEQSLKDIHKALPAGINTKAKLEKLAFAVYDQIHTPEPERPTMTPIVPTPPDSPRELSLEDAEALLGPDEFDVRIDELRTEDEKKLKKLEKFLEEDEVRKKKEDEEIAKREREEAEELDRQEAEREAIRLEHEKFWKENPRRHRDIIRDVIGDAAEEEEEPSSPRIPLDVSAVLNAEVDPSWANLPPITPSPFTGSGTGGEGIPLNTMEINELMKQMMEKNKIDLDIFKGTFARDQIDDVPVNKDKPTAFILNTDPSTKPGEHWVAVYFDPTGNATMEYYDSYGYVCPRDIVIKLKRMIDKVNPETLIRFKENMIRNQGDSNNCGYFAAMFLLARLSGYKWKFCTGFLDLREEEAEIFKKLTYPDY